MKNLRRLDTVERTIKDEYLDLLEVVELIEDKTQSVDDRLNAVGKYLRQHLSKHVGSSICKRIEEAGFKPTKEPTDYDCCADYPNCSHTEQLSAGRERNKKQQDLFEKKFSKERVRKARKRETINPSIKSGVIKNGKKEQKI